MLDPCFDGGIVFGYYRIHTTMAGIDLYLIYFFAGVLHHILFTLQIRSVDHDRKVAASISAFLVAVLSLAVLYNIFTHLQGTQGMIGIVSYAAGIGMGSFVAMKIRIRYKGKDLIG